MSSEDSDGELLRFPKRPSAASGILTDSQLPTSVEAEVSFDTPVPRGLFHDDRDDLDSITSAASSIHRQLEQFDQEVDAIPETPPRPASGKQRVNKRSITPKKVGAAKRESIIKSPVARQEKRILTKSSNIWTAAQTATLVHLYLQPEVQKKLVDRKTSDATVFKFLSEELTAAASVTKSWKSIKSKMGTILAEFKGTRKKATASGIGAQESRKLKDECPFYHLLEKGLMERSEAAITVQQSHVGQAHAHPIAESRGNDRSRSKLQALNSLADSYREMTNIRRQELEIEKEKLAVLKSLADSQRELTQWLMNQRT